MYTVSLLQLAAICFRTYKGNFSALYWVVTETKEILEDK